MSISWGNAAALLRIADAKKRADGWPETFTAQQLALLQYPTNDAKDNLSKQRGMIKIIHAAVESKQLDSEPNLKLDLNFDASPSLDLDDETPGFARFGISRSMPSRPIKRPTTAIATEKTYSISCHSFSAWWATQDVISSAHIQSWLNARIQKERHTGEQKTDLLIVKIKKSALVKKFEKDWPTIENDLSEATRNGLKDQAHLDPGYWDANAATAWAMQEGKWNPRQATLLEQVILLRAKTEVQF